MVLGLNEPAGRVRSSGGGVFRDVALHRQAGPPSPPPGPPVTRGPSFLLLWIIVAWLLAAGAVLVVLMLETRL